MYVQICWYETEVKMAACEAGYGKMVQAAAGSRELVVDVLVGGV